MIRLISRMLAVTLSAAAVFSTVSPEAAFAAASTAEETAAESGTSPDGETSDAGALPQDTTGRDERGEQTQDGSGSAAGGASETEPYYETSDGDADPKEGAEGSASGKTVETGNPADVEETAGEDPLNPSAEAAPEDAEKKDKEKTEALGRIVFRFDSAGGVVKIIVRKGDENALVETEKDDEDPDYILEKKDDGIVYVTERGGESKAAAVSEEGYVLEIVESAGTLVTASAVPAVGYRVSEFAVSTDAGDEKETGFEKGAEIFSYTADAAAGECSIFSVSFEEKREEADPSAAAAAKSPAKLLGAAREPNWTKGGSGIRNVSDKISIQHKDKYRYWYYKYGYLGGSHDDWSTFTYGVYMNGELVGWSVCVDPLYDGRDLDGVWAGEVYCVSAPMFVKALYYGAGGPGEDVIRGITGTGDYGANDIVTHVAVSEIYSRLGYSRSKIGDGFIDASGKLKDLVYRFVGAIEDLPVPDNYYGYVTEKNGYSYVGYPRQNFAFGSYSLTEGMAKVRKVSARPDITDHNQCYSLKEARYWVYKSKETALARGDDGWVSGGTLVTDENGVSNTITLSPGTYYLIEGVSPQGFALSDEVYTFTVSYGQTTEINVTDQIAGVPASLTIEKKCRNAGDKNINTLEGTQFTIDYYDGYYDESTLPADPARSWIIEVVKENGKYTASLSSDCLVRGSLYQMDGKPMLPLGTITIKETKAAPGYVNDGMFGDSDMYIGQIIQDPDKEPAFAQLVDISGTRAADNSFEVSDTPEKPSIRTQARDAVSGTQAAFAGGEVTIEDTVTYSNLIAGDEYSLSGKLIDRETGEIIKDAGGKEVTAEKTFTAEAIDGEVSLSFTFEADSTLAGRSTVVFETLLSEGEELAAHTDAADESQTIRFPGIRTCAVSPLTDDHIVPAVENAQIKDTVFYENLIPGTQYRLRSTVMDRSTGEVLCVGEEEVMSEMTFIPEKETGQTEVIFRFDASGLQGKDFVVFEELYIGETLIAAHRDPGDAGQTVSVPGVLTDVSDRDTSEKNSLAAKDRVIVDSISYSGLTAGKTYEITGEVRIRTEDAENFEEAEIVPAEIVSARGAGKVTFDAQKVTFIPEGEENVPVSGVLLVGFKVDASELAGENLVVGETVRFKGMDIAVHRDIRDDNQTDHIPNGFTTAVDTSTGIKNTLAAENRVLKDTFRYENLIPGMTYRFTGRVMVKTGTGEEGADVLEEIPSFMSDETGSPVENGFVEFVPEERNGSLDLYFSINAADLENREVTVFETVSIGGAPVIVHEALDGTQTLYVPEGRTSVIDSETGDRIAFPDKEVTLIDTMVYRNLIPGKEYTVRGRVMRKSTAGEIPSSLTKASYARTEGDEAQNPGGEIAVSENTVTFTPDTEDGALALTFEFDASQLRGEDVVVFERVCYNGREVIVHENIDDESQTVHLPGGHTTADDPESGGRTIKAGGRVIIRDQVHYENLIPGAEYSVRGKMMLKPSGKEKIRELKAKMVDQSGNEIKERVFTPMEPDGTVEVLFEVNSDGLAGRSVVAFEKMEFLNPGNRTGAAVFCHEDPEDRDQTVKFVGTETPGSRTGDQNKPLLWFLALAAAAAGVIFIKKRAAG